MQASSLRSRCLVALLAALTASAHLAIASVPAAASDSCADERNVFTGSVSGPGDVVVLPADGYTAGEVVHVGCVEGDGADLDLALSLVRGLPGEEGATVVATADDGGAHEHLDDLQAAGDFHWTVTSVAGSGDIVFGYSFSPAPLISPNCDDFDHHNSGSLEAPGDTAEFPAGGYVTDAVQLHEGCLEGYGGNDYDLHLARVEDDGSRTILRSGSRYPLDYGGMSNESSERLRFSVDAGRYVWIVENVEGSGSFYFGYSTRDPQPPAGCELEDVTTGGFDTTGQTHIVSVHPSTVEAGTPIVGCLASSEGTEVDFTLQHYDTSRGRWVAVVVDDREGGYGYIDHDAAGGRYRWVVRAVAGVGEFQLGHTAVPDTRITSSPPHKTDQTWATFALQSTEGDDLFRCRIDTEPAYWCEEPAMVSDLALGKHRFEARAVDGAGNLDPTPAVWTWEVVAPPEDEDVPLGSEWFVDVEPGHLFDREIGALRAAGVTRGCGPDIFCPADTVTRGQMAAFLVRALGSPAGDARFTDTRGHLFEADIAALADAGVTRGCGGGKFCPDDPVTRGQMAAFLDRADVLD